MNISIMSLWYTENCDSQIADLEATIADQEQTIAEQTQTIDNQNDLIANQVNKRKSLVYLLQNHFELIPGTSNVFVLSIAFMSSHLKLVSD